MEDILTVEEAATLLRVSRQTLYLAIRSGEFPHFRIGSKIRIRKTDIEQIISGGISVSTRAKETGEFDQCVTQQSGHLPPQAMKGRRQTLEPSSSGAVDSLGGEKLTPLFSKNHESIRDYFAVLPGGRYYPTDPATAATMGHGQAIFESLILDRAFSDVDEVEVRKYAGAVLKACTHGSPDAIETLLNWFSEYLDIGPRLRRNQVLTRKKDGGARLIGFSACFLYAILCRLGVSNYCNPNFNLYRKNGEFDGEPLLLEEVVDLYCDSDVKRDACYRANRWDFGERFDQRVYLAADFCIKAFQNQGIKIGTSPYF